MTDAHQQKTSRAWQRMLSGRRLDLLNPSPLDIEIEDIAHGLARVARWNGQTTGNHAYSVAQHSLLVLDIFRRYARSSSEEDDLAALLHDAAEYVVGDIISPFKVAVGGNYKAVELSIQRAIHIRFSLPPEPTATLARKIKRADAAAAWFEATRLAGFSRKEAARYFGEPSIGISEELDLEPKPAKFVQKSFVDAFNVIEKCRSKQKA